MAKKRKRKGCIVERNAAIRQLLVQGDQAVYERWNRAAGKELPTRP
jgi:hypothetical protein